MLTEILNRAMRLFCVLCVVSILTGCNPCSDEVLSEVHSPDGVMTATLFIRDCGATTDFSSIVSIHRKGRGFRSEDDRVFVAKGRHDFDITWTGPNALMIRCGNCAPKEVFRQTAKLGKIDISFDQDSK